MTDNRKVFTMSDAQFDKLMKAFQPTPAIMLQCGPPRSQQEYANAAWRQLADELGFVWDTVRPHGRDQKQFTAEVKS